MYAYIQKNLYNVYSLVLVLRKYLAFFGGRHLGAFSVRSPWHSMASRGQTPLVVTALAPKEEHTDRSARSLM